METEIIVALITAGFALITALSVAMIQRHRTIEQGVQDVREQVKNSHATNLRDDLDKINRTVELTLRSVEGIHEQLHLERRERLLIADRLQSHIGDCQSC